jgi:Tellurite resistance protein TehB.
MWNQRYAVDDYVYGKAPNDFLREQHGAIPKGKVLCLAEGEGRNAVYLASLGYEVWAVDASSVGRDKALKLAKEMNVSLNYEVADLAEYDLGNNEWSGIVSIFCHLPPALRESLHRRVVAALKPGGVILLEGYRPDQLEFGTGGPPSKELMMSAQQLQSDFSLLSVVHLQELERDVTEGICHTGEGAVVQMVASK